MRQIKESIVHRLALERSRIAICPRQKEPYGAINLLWRVGLDQNAQLRGELPFNSRSGGMMHISDAVLDCLRRSLPLAAECTDERVAVELNLLAIKLLLEAVKDAELIVEQSPVLTSTCAVGAL